MKARCDGRGLRRVAVLAVVLWHAAGAYAVDGTALGDWTNPWGVLLVDMATGQKRNLPAGGRTYACFSPDGRQIAAARSGKIITMYNDGTHITEICNTVGSGGYPAVSWCTDGCIYWAEHGASIYRVNIATRQRTTVGTFTMPYNDYVSSPAGSKIWKLSVCLDGTRAAATNNPSDDWHVVVFDLVAVTVRDIGTGCMGSISPDGQLVTHNRNGTWRGLTYHQWFTIDRFTNATSVDTFAVPGAAAGNDVRGDEHRFSHSSNDFVSLLVGDGRYYLIQRSTKQNWLIHQYTADEMNYHGPQIWDFWPGQLPPPPSSSPYITLDRSSLSFVSTGGSVPATQTVTATNTGAGTMSGLTVTESASWLTVTVSGSGNTQTLTNAVSPTSLSSGTYQAAVTVSGGGATSAASYTVSFNVGTTLAAPGSLQAAALGDTAVRLSWHDNAVDETGFALERAVVGGAFAEVVRTGANDTDHVDKTVLVDITYTYRVRAVRGNEFSGYASPCTLVVRATPKIAVTSPAAGAVWPAGSSQRIQWSVVAVNRVTIQYTVDDGETWHDITTTAALGAGDPGWGDYPWVVPESLSTVCRIAVREYGGGVAAQSGTFTISSGSARGQRPGGAGQAVGR